MRKADVKIGGRYVAKVSNQLTTVQILAERTYGGGWHARNVKTGRSVHIRSAQRLRSEVAS